MPFLLIFALMKTKKDLFERFLWVGFIFLFATIIFFDQLIKQKIRSNGGFFVCNKAFSLGISFNSFLYWAILCFVFVFAIVFCLKLKHSVAYFSQKLYFFACFSLILGGAASNMLDRTFFGCVFDYINPLFKSFPLFNLADITISTGCTILLVLILTKNTPKL